MLEWAFCGMWFSCHFAKWREAWHSAARFIYTWLYCIVCFLTSLHKLSSVGRVVSCRRYNSALHRCMWYLLSVYATTSPDCTISEHAGCDARKLQPQCTVSETKIANLTTHANQKNSVLSTIHRSWCLKLKDKVSHKNWLASWVLRLCQPIYIIMTSISMTIQTELRLHWLMCHW